MVRQRIDDAAERARAWLFDGALGLWAEVGLDRETGGFVDWLNLDGAPALDAAKRLRVQARQIYVFSRAALAGWDGPGLATARAGHEFLIDHFWHSDGGWIFSVDRQGRPRDQTRGTYEQAFALLAFAWYHRASGDAGALDWAGRTLEFLDHALADPEHGGYHESIPERLPRRQNPHMHLLEALVALHQATGNQDYLVRAGALAELFRDRFFDASSGTLGESFAADWSPLEGAAGRELEPGHHFEWAWLLHEYARATGEIAILDAADLLYGFAWVHGTDPADGLAYDAVAPDGTPRRQTKRLWPQTEALKAHLALRQSAAHPEAAGRAEAALDGLFDKYLCLRPGLWREQLGPDRVNMADRVPASSLYHLYLALAEYLRVRAPAAAVTSADRAPPDR